MLFLKRDAEILVLLGSQCLLTKHTTYPPPLTENSNVQYLIHFLIGYLMVIYVVTSDWTVATCDVTDQDSLDIETADTQTQTRRGSRPRRTV